MTPDRTDRRVRRGSAVTDVPCAHAGWVPTGILGVLVMAVMGVVNHASLSRHVVNST